MIPDNGAWKGEVRGGMRNIGTLTGETLQDMTSDGKTAVNDLLSCVKAFFIDLEGTLYFKGRAFEGAAEVLDTLRVQGYALRFITNSDSKRVSRIAADLQAMGLVIRHGEILSPAVVAGELLRQEQATCYPLLSPALLSELEHYTCGDDEVADYVLIGDLSENLCYDRLNRAFGHLVNGAQLLALQAGRYYIRENGQYLDTGAFVRALEYASGLTARILGKPSADLFRLGLSQLGLQAGQVAVIGDDPATDVEGARSIGAFSILVRTGKSEGNKADAAIAKPDLTLSAFSDLLTYLGGAR